MSTADAWISMTTDEAKLRRLARATWCVGMMNHELAKRLESEHPIATAEVFALLTALETAASLCFRAGTKPEAPTDEQQP
jgi:hypothetical protein